MKHKPDNIFEFVTGTLQVFIMVALLADILFLKLPVLEILGISFVCYGLMSIFFLTKLSSLIFLMVSGVASMLILIICWTDTPISKHVLWIVEGINELWYRVTYYLPYQTREMMLFAWVFVGLAAFAAAALVVVFYKKYGKFFVSAGIIISVTLYSWYMTGKENRVLFALTCCIIVISYLRSVYFRKKKLGLVAENASYGLYMIFCIPILIIPLLTVNLLPKSDRPMQWKWLHNKLNSWIENFTQQYSSLDAEFFSLSKAGFNGRTHRLGGPVFQNNTIVMEVNTVNRTYLRGPIYAWYENNSWIQSRDEKEEGEGFFSREFEKDIRELWNGWSTIPVDELFPAANEEERALLRNLASGKINDMLYRTYPIEVEFRNMSTRTIFMPVKSILPLKNLDGAPIRIFINYQGRAFAVSKQQKGYHYGFEYVQPMYGEPMFQKALTFSRKNLYKDSMQIWISKREKLKSMPHSAGELSAIDDKVALLSELYERAVAIEEEYTQLSDRVPQRVKNLAVNLTGKCKSDYEKVIAIQNYLRENYYYTLSPDSIPPGRDFVDYFLFENNSGYCSYYATAMAVLLKSVGIPSRYIEGYVLPDKSPSRDTYIVTNKYAHAWVEVYFEGFGWLTFEPTSAFAGIMDYRQRSPYGENIVSEYDPSLEELIDGHNQAEDFSEQLPADSDAGNRNSSKKYLPIISIGIAGLIILLYLLNVILCLIGAIKMRWSRNDQKVILIYAKILSWFSIIGHNIRTGETAKEYSRRIDRQYCFETTCFENITGIFYKTRFGNYLPASEDIKVMKAFSKELRKLVVNNMGMKRYLPLRYLFYGI